jgi:hypothetical protein
MNESNFYFLFFIFFFEYVNILNFCKFKNIYVSVHEYILINAPRNSQIRAKFYIFKTLCNNVGINWGEE